MNEARIAFEEMRNLESKRSRRLLRNAEKLGLSSLEVTGNSRFDTRVVTQKEKPIHYDNSIQDEIDNDDADPMSFIRFSQLRGH